MERESLTVVRADGVRPSCFHVLVNDRKSNSVVSQLLGVCACVDRGGKVHGVQAKHTGLSPSQPPVLVFVRTIFAVC